MFAKASLLASLVPLATAITFNTPSNAAPGQSLTISWTSTSSDPSVFTIELVNGPLLGNEIAIANNVPTSQGSVVVPSIPIVPLATNYTIQAVDISNIASVFGTSSEFPIAAPVSSSSSSTTAGSSSSVSGSGSASITSATSPASGSTVVRPGPSSIFTPPGSSSSAGSASGSGTSSASASPTNSSFNGALGVQASAFYTGSFAVAALGAIAVLAGFAL